MSEQWRQYQCEYRHAGHEWGVEITATSIDDARARLRCIGTTGQVRGEIALKVHIGSDYRRAVAGCAALVFIFALWLAGVFR